MKKCKLPRNWITVNSKSHPDRIYYFNIKTNQSTWIQPALDDTNSLEPVRKRRKNYDEKEEHSKAVTPERNFLGDEIVNRQKSRHKKSFKTAKKTAQENDTPQMKVLKERLLQRQKIQAEIAKSKSSNKDKACASSSSSLRKSSRQTGNNIAASSLKRSHSEMEKNNNSSLSRSSQLKSIKNKSAATSHIETDSFVKLTPQMQVLYEKIQQRESGASNLHPNLKVKSNSKGEQQSDSAEKLVRTQEKQKRTVSNQKDNNWNKKDTKLQQNSQTKKNLAKERLQKLQKSFSFDKKTFQEIGCSATEKTSQKVNKTLPVSHYSGMFGHHKNVRLKRLHNKILREAMHETSTALNNDKLLTQQCEELNCTMTKEKLIEQITRNFCEDMDWEPMNDVEITLEVEVIRTQLSQENCTNVTNSILKNDEKLTQSLESSQEKGPLYIVIDTNVFLTNLEIIEEARDATFKTYPRPFIIIPWTVIRELDYFKCDKSRSESLRSKARLAISFINEHFASKHPRIIGQTRDQAARNKETFHIDCPDDEILQCCLQIMKLQKSVVLLSYDKNLCNKAMMFNVMTLGRNDPFEKIDYWSVSDKIINPLNNDPVENVLFNEELHLSDDIYAVAKEIMKDFLSAIITKQMSDIYGAEWQIYVIIKPPWNIVTVLKCAIKHWIAAINESFYRRSLSIIKELLQIFEHLPVGGRKLQDVENILEKCSELIESTNSKKHSDIMSKSLNDITKLKKRCTKCIADINLKKLEDKLGTVKNDQEQEERTERALQCFRQIYNYTRDFCGTAANIAGKAFPLNFNPLNPSLSPISIKLLQPDIAKKVTDLTQSLDELLMQSENNLIKYQTLLTLQQNMQALMNYFETMIVNSEAELLDIFCCARSKKEILLIGLRQLQELSTHYRALY